MLFHGVKVPDEFDNQIGVKIGSVRRNKSLAPLWRFGLYKEK
jgi:hypothetical protein